MIKRSIFNELKEHLSQKEIALIVGPRQAGKTTVMGFLKDYLAENGKKTISLNLDIETDKMFFESQEKLISKIRLEIGNEGYVFVDEIQRKEDAGLFLKGIYDMSLPYKFIVSGSGSVELKEKVHESLAGRKRYFPLSTITFEEFANYKTDYKYETKLADFFRIEKEKVKNLLEEYLNFGGYPRVVLAETADEKRRIIDEIYRSYVEKDIVALLEIKKSESFTSLVRILASQAGNLINYSEIANTLGLSTKTVKDYIWYLEKTFVLERVTPFSGNVRKEITKSPVVYFNDLGLKNYAAGVFGNIESHNAGFVFENLIFNVLKEEFYAMPFKINFWRTVEGGEVDFVISSAEKIVPIEVKYQYLKKAVVPRSLRNFIKRYKSQKGVLISLDFKESIKIDDAIIEFINFRELLALKTEQKIVKELDL